MSRASSWLYSFNSERLFEKFPKKQTSRARTISISSGKGGVGKTSVAIKFSKSLAEQGKKVLLIDCDFNLSNTSIKLGIPLNNNFYDLLSLKKDFKQCLYKDGNFHLLPASNGDLNLFNDNLSIHEVIIDIITSHEDEYDFIILDSPAGVNKETVTLNAYCDQRFIVVTPDRSSITDSYSLMKILSKHFSVKENHLIVNMFNSKKQYEKVVKTISETAESFLGVRSYILGGLRKYDIPADTFDRFFLEVDNSAAQKDFVKLVECYSEKFLGHSNVGMIPQKGDQISSIHKDVH